MASNPRRANGSARDKVVAQVKAEEADCWICGESVDKTLTMEWGKHGPKCQDPGCPGCVPHEMRAEVDEVLPVSQGGNPIDRANCRLSHRRCNRERNRHKPKVVRHDPGLFPISDCWDGLFDSLRVGGDPLPARSGTSKA